MRNGTELIGRILQGRVRRTLVRGITIFRDGAIVSAPVGRLVKPGARH